MEHALWRKGLDLLCLCYSKCSTGSEHHLWDSLSTPRFLSHQSLTPSCLGLSATPYTLNTPGLHSTFAQQVQVPYLRQPWLKERTFPLKGKLNRNLKFLGSEELKLQPRGPKTPTTYPILINSKPHRAGIFIFPMLSSLSASEGGHVHKVEAVWAGRHPHQAPTTALPSPALWLAARHVPLEHLLSLTYWMRPQMQKAPRGALRLVALEWQSWVHFYGSPSF